MDSKQYACGMQIKKKLQVYWSLIGGNRLTELKKTAQQVVGKQNTFQQKSNEFQSDGPRKLSKATANAEKRTVTGHMCKHGVYYMTGLQTCGKECIQNNIFRNTEKIPIFTA